MRYNDMATKKTVFNLEDKINDLKETQLKDI